MFGWILAAFDYSVTSSVITARPPITIMNLATRADVVIPSSNTPIELLILEHYEVVFTAAFRTSEMNGISQPRIEEFRVVFDVSVHNEAHQITSFSLYHLI